MTNGDSRALSTSHNHIHTHTKYTYQLNELQNAWNCLKVCRIVGNPAQWILCLLWAIWFWWWWASVLWSALFHCYYCFGHHCLRYFVGLFKILNSIDDNKKNPCSILFTCNFTQTIGNFLVLKIALFSRNYWFFFPTYIWFEYSSLELLGFIRRKKKTIFFPVPIKVHDFAVK